MNQADKKLFFSVQNKEEFPRSIEKAKMDTRQQFRKKSEKLAILNFLIYSYKHGLLDFPFVLWHRDKPDFKLSTRSLKMGIETTKSTTEQYERSKHLRDKYLPNSSMEPTMFNSTNPKRNNSQIVSLIEKSNEDLIGLPTYGFQAEINWALSISEAVKRKTKKLQKNDWTHYPQNSLLIEDDYPDNIIGIEIKKALYYLESFFLDYWNQKTKTFELIFMLSNKKLYLFQKGFDLKIY